MYRDLMRVASAVAVAGVVFAGPAAAGDRPGLGERLYNGYDPCWPDRYAAVARQEVLAPFAQQALNGHIMNHTLWNYHFEPGTDRLTPAGFEKLDSLVRTRPFPDPKVFVQTARDLAVTADTVDKLAETRLDLDNKRALAVAKYMAAQPRPMPFEIFVHDPTDNSINSIAATNAYRGQLMGYRGGISGSGISATGSGGGTVSASSTGAGAAQGTNPNAPVTPVR